MEKVSAKRIIIALLPLIFFNVVLVADLLVFSKMAWSKDKNEKKYEYGKDEKVFTALMSTHVKSGEQTLFGYEGADANCYKQFDKGWKRDVCLREHPYGGQGTLIVGGNVVLENAQAIYLNGSDSAGFSWIMSSTSEPYGNAMAIRNAVEKVNKAVQLAYGTVGPSLYPKLTEEESQDNLNFGANIMADGTIKAGVSLAAKKDDASVFYGNHLLADGTIRTGAVHFQAAAISVIFNQRSDWMVDEGVFENVGRLIFANYKFGSGSDVFSILEKGVCGVCGESCALGNAGKDYQFINKHGLDVKEVLKVNKEVRFCGEGQVKECEEACCRLAQYSEDDTYCNQAPYHNFVAYDCAATCLDEPKDEYGEGPSYCYPQPYPKWVHLTGPPLDHSYQEENGYTVRGGTGGDMINEYTKEVYLNNECP